jgi:hypothetical protein
MRILEGRRLYEKGKAVGEFTLKEGQLSEKMVIIESGFTDLHEVALNDEEKALLQEKSSDGKGYLLVLEGIFQRDGVPNANNRIYPSKIWDKALSDPILQKRIANGEMLGECDHPKDGETLLSRVAGMVTKVYRNPDNLKEIMGRMVVFNTASGRNILAIHEGGGRIGVSSRGAGSVVRQDGVDIVQDDYELETWDIVHNPSTSGAYPTVTKESKAVNVVPVTESKEISAMSRLQELADRFDRCRNRDLSTLSEDAINIVKEDINFVRESLLKEDFSKDSTKAAALVAEVVTFQAHLPTPAPKKVEEKEPEKFTAEPGTEAPKKEDPPVTTKRAESVEETIGILRKEYKGDTRDSKEATKIARQAYRDAVKLEGALVKHELDGISKFVTEVTTKEVSESKDATAKATSHSIKATFSKPDGTREEKVFSTDKELTEAIKAFAPNSHIVEIDRSDSIYESCSKRFEPLLESQTIKALNAVNELAKVRASSTALSAKVSAAVQVIDALKERVTKSDMALKEAAEDFEAAIKLIEALSDEADAEKMRGTVEALAATNPHLPQLGESISKAKDPEEAIRITKTMFLEGLKKVNREPVEPESDTRITEAITKSEGAKVLREKEESGKNLPYSVKRDQGVADMTKMVLTRMKEQCRGK